MAHLGQASKQLQDALSNLMHQYQNGCQGWHDPVQQKFESEFIQTYEPMVRSVSRQIDAIASLIAQAEREIP